MLVKPTVTELLKKADNRYELVNIISRRARQLVDGQEKMVKTKELSPITLASLEFDDDKIYLTNNEDI